MWRLCVTYRGLPVWTSAGVTLRRDLVRPLSALVALVQRWGRQA